MNETSNNGNKPIIGRESQQSTGDHRVFVEPIVERLEPNGGRTHGATGPRTQLGKERSKMNSLKHGLYSKSLVLKNESRAEYESLLDGLQFDFQPHGEIEERLVENLAVILWRKRRLLLLENNEFEEMASVNRARVITLEVCLARVEAHLSREFDRTLAQLDRIKSIRADQPASRTSEIDRLKALLNNRGGKALALDT
jgi:hypothetical protein